MEEDEFLSKIDVQIDKATELAKANVKTNTDLLVFEEKYTAWLNEILLLLSDKSNSVPEGVSKYFHINKGSNSISHQSQKLKSLKDEIDNKIQILIEVKKAYSKTESEKIMNGASIFIVHGHDEEYKSKLVIYLHKLDLVPIILAELAAQGDTLIEKLEKNSNVGFAIVLLTKDDEGKKKGEENLQPRARQNVILELGYFIGKIGRNRVLCLFSEGLEKPSDYDGVIYTPLDPTGNWRFKLVKELQGAGYNVDANKLL